MLHENLTTVLPRSDSIWYGPVHNPIGKSHTILVATHSNTMASSLGCHFVYLYMHIHT